MKQYLLLSACLFAMGAGHAQSIQQKLATAIASFEADLQMKHAITALYVVDTKTGKPVYAHNSEVGLAPASTQKLFTSVAAFDLLGNNYRYRTKLGYWGKINAEGVLNGNLYIIGSGDPTLGSPRWKSTTDSVVLRSFSSFTQKAGIKRIDGYIATSETGFSSQAIPDGWIWQDIGNYYGAGAYPVNWRENQYDLLLRSGAKVGDSVDIYDHAGVLLGSGYLNELTAGAKGSGDNAYIYPGLGVGEDLVIKGTIPVNEKAFAVSGAVFNPTENISIDLSIALMTNGIMNESPCKRPDFSGRSDKEIQDSITVIGTHVSPPLDSINYWFLRRSINLYGEALVKTIGYEKAGIGATDKGVELVRNFWQQQGIEKSAIHIADGSGLSPQNRVTTDALVKVLLYAKGRPWYSSFYNALPEYNGMKMKSGSINGARAYAGYHTAKDGKEYTYAIIVNNYDGSAGEVVKKMYKVLDVLK